MLNYVLDVVVNIFILLCRVLIRFLMQKDTFPRFLCDCDGVFIIKY